MVSYCRPELIGTPPSKEVTGKKRDSAPVRSTLCEKVVELQLQHTALKPSRSSQLLGDDDVECRSEVHEVHSGMLLKMLHDDC